MELAGLSLISPTFHEVISVVVHAFRVIEEQREAHERCVVRQSVYCDDDMNNFEVLAREQAEASTATTAATLEVQVDLFVRCIPDFHELLFWHMLCREACEFDLERVLCPSVGELHPHMP